MFDLLDSLQLTLFETLSIVVLPLISFALLLATLHPEWPANVIPALLSLILSLPGFLILTSVRVFVPFGSIHGDACILLSAPLSSAFFIVLARLRRARRKE